MDVLTAIKHNPTFIMLSMFFAAVSLVVAILAAIRSSNKGGRARMKGRFRRCYSEGLATKPDMQGATTLVAKIGPKGQVMAVGGGAGGDFTFVRQR